MTNYRQISVAVATITVPIVAVLIHCSFVVNIVHSLQIPSVVTLPSKVTSFKRTTYPYFIHPLRHNLQQQQQQRATPLSTALFASDIESSSSSSTPKSLTSTTTTIPTLSLNTTWMIRMTLRNVKTQKGRTISNQMYVLYGQFTPLENYEPPQGTFAQLLPAVSNFGSTPVVTDTSSSNSMKIVSSRWILSEDPNDRKDGLWIWGLFQQPLYPFLLLSLETNRIPISTSGTDDDDDYIPALQLYVQLDHTCNRDTGSVAFTKRTSDANNNYELMIRQKEIIAADPLSLSKVEIYEEVSIGTFSIQPKQ